MFFGVMSLFFFFFNFMFFGMSWMGGMNLLGNELFSMLYLVFLIFCLSFLSIKLMEILFGLVFFFSFFFFFSKSFVYMYMFLEFCLVPTMMMIFFFGLQPEKMKAMYYFFFFTVCSGYFLVFAFSFMKDSMHIYFLKEKSNILVFFLSFGFLVKMPLYGVHFWLPLAHTEAPSLGSIVLAGLLLKLGGFGTIMIFFIFKMFFSNLIFFFCFMGSLMSSLLCSVQSDGKVLIAYSSIAHMNFGLFCMCFFCLVSKESNFLMMLTHGVTASLMFWFFGYVYYSSFSRSLYFVKGLQFFFFFFTFLILLTNFGVPPFLSFLQEFFFFFSIFSFSWVFFFFFVVFFVVMMYYNIFFFFIFLKKKKMIFFYLVENLMMIFSCLFSLNYFIMFFMF